MNSLKRSSLLLLFFLISSFVIVPTASAACPETGSQEFGDVGGQVQLIACTDEGLTGSNQSVTIDTPVATLPGAATASALGDLLIAVVQTDGPGETLNNVANYDGDWTPAIGTPYINALNVTSMIWTRVVDGTESASYTFDWNSGEQVYGYILRFSGASGLYQMATNRTGTSNTPITNSVTVNALNSLVLRMVSVDRRPIVEDVRPNATGHTLITMESSRPTGGGGGATVSGGAAYRYAAGTGATGTVNFNSLTLTGSEEWHARAMAIEPYEFRFSMPDATAGVCGVQQVTLSVTNSAGLIPPGSPMENFAGEVTLSASFSTGATWNDGAGLTNSIVDLGNGNATYQFDPADNGVAVFEYYNSNLGNVVDFGVSYNNFVESTNYTSPSLTIINCEFVVTNDVGDEVATCAMEAVTITLRDTDGNAADNYSGTLSIDNGSGDSFGNYVLNAGHTGAGTFLDAIADDGKATYTYALTPAAGSNVLILDYIHGSADLSSINFAISEDSGDVYLVDSITSLDVISCEILVSLVDGDTTRDVCTFTRVQFEISAGGSTVTNYNGVINITTSATQGLWLENALETYPGALTGGGAGDGTASYDFDGTEGGEIIIDFRNQVTATGLGLAATGLSDDGIALPQGGAPAVLTDIAQCTLTITTANATVGNIADVCRPSEEVTYTLTDRDGGAATGYTGTIVLQTSTAKGNYDATPIFGAGTLIGPGGNNGSATYEFAAADDGVLTIGYSVLAAPAGPGTVTLTASLPSVALVNTDGTFTFRNCVFNISFPSDTAPFETDVCSIKQVRIDLVDFDGDPVTDYTGTINLTTTSGFGSWSADASANGTLTDPFGEDGAASYTFVDTNPGTDPGDDDGVLILDFTHTAAAAPTLNINVTDSVTSDPGNPGSANDPILAVDLCTFQISFDGGGGSLHDDAFISACTVQAVTIEVFDSTGALAIDYAGQINISTSTSNGNWGIGTGNQGSLSGAVVDGGVVSYTFNDDGVGLDDDGSVTLDFSALIAETVNFNIVDEVIALSLDGVIVEEGAADPNLEIGSCIPTVAQRVCAAGGNPLTISLPITAQVLDPALQGRMVAVATVHEGNGTVSGITFDGPSLTELKNIRVDEGGNDSYATLWAMDETLLPTAVNSYDVVVTHSDDNLAACAFFFTDVEQVFPAENLVTPDSGQLNATSSPDNDVTVASTTITTTENNALVLSIVGIGNAADTTDVSPSPPMTNFSPQPTDPAGGGFGGASGNASNAAAITIDQTMSIDPTFRHTHIVAAFNPLISGPPQAEGYEPVVLFKTYSGNVSYRAIGASFQTVPNGSSTCAVTTSATATLTLPDVADGVLAGNGTAFSANGEFDSDIQAAWLYWFASGSNDLPNINGGGTVNTQTPADFDNVTLTSPDGSGGSNVTNITADGIFYIEDVSGFNLDYYAAYKDVTEVLVGSDNELTGSDENPNGDYTITNMALDSGQPWLGPGACAGGFALVVVYENPYEQLRVMNLFHGFQPFLNSSFTLVPRNFRIADRDTDRNEPNGQVTHITVEGDAGIRGPDEELTLQNDPDDFDPLTFNNLFTDFNPAQEEYNGTISRPIFTLQDIVPVADGDPNDPTEYAYIFTPTGVGDDAITGNPSNGYELDFPNPAFFDGTFNPPQGTGTQYGTSYGVDIDTHFIDGDELGDVLYEFADPGDLAEKITTRYSADGDLVLLVAEMISVTNDDIADIEVTITEADSEYKVNTTTGTYNIEVKNNGSGAAVYGVATGTINLVGELPTGMTLNSNVTGTGWACSTTVDSITAFSCSFDASTADSGSGFGSTPLSIVSMVVDISGPPANFPSLNNNVKIIVRVQHSDGTCLGASTGILPTPSSDCQAPEFDNVNDLQGGALDINDLEDKSGSNNNVHSVTTNVKGIETDLSVVKAVTTILEEGSNDSAIYTITVTNNGPDPIVGGLTQPAITITDNEPVGINFDSASGTNWDCTVNTVPNPDQLVCTFDNLGVGSIASGFSSVITVVGDVTGSSPDAVTNTVQVASGLYNFDIVPGNNTFATTDSIASEPPVVTDKFLLSVSATGNVSLGSGAGELSDFSENDIILYDPQTDSAEQFIDASATPGFEVTNPNAVHLLPNGKVVLSASGTDDEIGTNDLVFQPEDIVLYDKLLNTATLLFDGSLYLTDESGGTIPLNIDAVYVLNDGSIIFSTAGPASGNRTGGGTESWSDSDLVRYDPSDNTFLVYLDAEDDDVFDAVDAQVDAAYLRVDPGDATDVLDTFVLSSAVQGAVLGGDNVIVGRDDVAEIEITTGTPAVPTGSTSTSLFNGGVPIGVFDTTDPTLTLNALHLIEPAYLGHFEISEVVQGNACTPAKIRIRKHLGTSHATDTSYTGSIVISTDSDPVNGIWLLDTGDGALDNSFGGSPDNGQALYTFVADDDGEVILTLDVSDSPPAIDSVNLSVTNGFTVDGDTGDNPFEFNLVSTDVNYRDSFSVAAFNNSDGSAAWSGDWVEVDAFNGVSGSSGAGMTTGNIRMNGGKLTLTSNSNTDGGLIDPSMARAAGLGFFDYTEPVEIKFNYGYQSVTDSGDEIVLQISNDGSTYIDVKTYNTLDGTSVSDVAETVDISASITNNPGDVTPTNILIDDSNTSLYVRFVITDGYVLGTFTVDDFQVTTSTTSCSTDGLVHYHIDIPLTGLACVTSNVIITGHDFGHNDVAIPNGTVLTLTTGNGAGSWVNSVGTGTLTSTPLDKNGQGSYTLTGGEEMSVQLKFNYTDPAGDGAAVNINVSDGFFTEVQDPVHDPQPNFSEAGIVFYNQVDGSLGTTLPFQIAGKPSLTAPASGNVTLQIVRSTLNNPDENAAAACKSLVGDGDVVTITLAGLCIDPMGCDAGASSIMTIVDSNDVAQDVPVFSSPTANPEAQGSATTMTLEFSADGAAIGTVPQPEENIGAPINFMYPNSGKISLHAEYEIPFDNDIAGDLSGDTINGASETFIVRPFGFDIDFDSPGNLGNDRGGLADLSLAADANGPAFARAGVGFNATVSAVLWQQGDDVELVDGTAGNDGIPDFEADLSDNLVATNFGDEAVDNNTVEISVYTTDPTNSGAANPGVPTGVTGTMVIVDGSSDIFQGFASGVSGPQLIAIDEVGIFDLGAQLVDNNMDRNAINYFESAPYTAVEGVAGGARNVGRIYPNNFELVTAPSFGPRSNQAMVCAMASPFTYMGEDFTVNITLDAKNFQGTTLQNYFAGFAKLNSFAELDIRAIVDVVGGADIDLDADGDDADLLADMRLERSTFPNEFGSLTVSTMDDWSAGQILLSGDLRITRQPGDAPEAPLENVRISFSPVDNNINDGDIDDDVASNDVLLDVFNVDLDDGSPDIPPFEDLATGPFQFAEIAKHEFRYGRLLVQNAFGSESEDLQIGIRIEYFDGDDFIVNAADSCTAIVQTNGAEELAYVPGTYEDAGADLVPPLDPFVDGVTVIEDAPGTDVTVTVSGGQSNFEADSDADLTNDSDRPFFTTAPDPEAVGRVLVELDLDPNDDESPSSLYFLQYDWRGGAGEGIGDYANDLFDEEAEGMNYDDNPRAIIEFGSFRGHDRVINWQEIYIGPTGQ